MILYKLMKWQAKSYVASAAKASKIAKAIPVPKVAPDPEISRQLLEISGRLSRIEYTQKETSLQLEEIDSLLQENSDSDELAVSIIALVGMIEDFYRFAADNPESALFSQASMMWDAAKNTAETAGLSLIERTCEPFDFQLCSAESTECDHGIPTGYVIKTLKCGYIFKDKILKRASVIINKTDTPHEGVQL